MQAKVKSDFRFDAVTAATVVFVKNEWRNVPPGWEERVQEGYGHCLEFQSQPKEPEPVAAPTGESAVVTTKPETTEPAATPAETAPPPAAEPAAHEPSVAAAAVPAVDMDAVLETEAEVDETAAAQAEAVAAEDRAAAAAKRAAKKASK